MTMGTPFQQILTDSLGVAVLDIVGFGVLASVIAMGVAFVYRERTTREIPMGAGIILGIAVIALWLNLRALIGSSLVGEIPLIGHLTGAYLLGLFITATVSAEIGRRIGDYLSCDVFGIERLGVRGDIAELVKSGGIVVTVQLPEEIADLEGYPPVDDEIKRRLAAQQMQFPRNLSINDIGDRLERRLETDYDVGQAEVEMMDDGNVGTVAVGRQPTGLGPTLPPEQIAVGIRSDPASTASLGDPIEVWTDGSTESELVATGTLQASVGDVATVLLDPDDAPAIEVDERYRITTRPETPTDKTEFLSVLRVSEESITSIEVEENGPFHGEFVSWLPVSVLLIDRDDEVLPFPDQNETLRAGDIVYALGTPIDLYKLVQYRNERSDGDAATSASGNPLRIEE